MKLDTKALKNHGFNFLKSQYLDDYEINNIFTGVKSTKQTPFAEIAEETFNTIETVLDEHLVTIAHAAISPMHLMEKPLIDAKLEAIDLLSETIKCNPVLINEICTFVSLLNYYKKGTVAEPHGEIFITYFKSDEGSNHALEKEFERLLNVTYEYKTDKMLYSRDQFNDFKIMLYEEVKQVYDRNNKKTDSDYLKMITDLLEKMGLCGTSYEKARVISLHKIMTKYGPQEILKKYKLIDSISNENLDMFIKHCEYLQKYKKHCRAVSVFSPLKLKYKNMSLLGESGKHIAENEMIRRINDLLGDDHKMKDVREMLENATKELTQLLLDYPNDTHISPNKWINERSEFVLNSHKDPELYKQVCRMGYDHWDKKYSYVIKSIIESIDEFCETNEFGLQIPCISKQEQLLDDTLWDCVNAFAGLSTRDDIEILTNSTFFKNKFISTDEKIKICKKSPLYTGPLTPDYIDKMIALLLAFDDSDENNHDELNEDSYDDIDYALSKVVEDNKHKPSHVIEYYKTSPIRPLLIDITKNRNMKDTVKVCKESKFCNDSHSISLKIELCEDILSSINFDKYMRVHTATNILIYYLKNQELLETYPVQEQTQTVEKKSFVREVMNRFKKLF